MLFESILIGMDFSEPAVKAATWAVSVFARGANVTLLHVIDPPDRPRFAEGVLPTAEAIETAARDYAETQLRRISELLGQASHPGEVPGRHEVIQCLFMQVVEQAPVGSAPLEHRNQAGLPAFQFG